MKPIPILAVGTRPANNGIPYTFTQEDLEAMAASFNAAKPKVPFAPGHGWTDEALADAEFGHPEELAVKDGVLNAVRYRVNDVFRKVVNSGELNRISARLRVPDHPENKTGTYELRHVAFLGRTPPADETMIAAFSADPHEIEFSTVLETPFAEPPVVPPTIEVSPMITETAIAPTVAETAPVAPATITADALKAALEAAGKFSAADVATILQAAKVQPPEPVPAPEPIASDLAEKIAALEAQVAEQNAAIAEKEAALAIAAEKQAEFSRAEAVRPLMSKLADKGYGGHVPALTALFSNIPLEDKDIEFSAADGAVTKPAGQILQEFLEQLPARVTVGGDEVGGGDVEFSTADPTIRAKAIADYATTHGVTMTQAMVAVRKGAK